MKELEGIYILIVDDEEHIRQMICEEFTELGAVVTIADNGTDALALLRKTAYHVVISDMKMPGGDGIEFLRKFAGQTPAPKIFLCTGFNDYSLKEIKSLGVLEVFSKPFEWDHMIDAVRNSLHKAS